MCWNPGWKVPPRLCLYGRGGHILPSINYVLDEQQKMFIISYLAVQIATYFQLLLTVILIQSM